MGLYDRSVVYSRQVQTAFRDGGTGHVAFSVARKLIWPVCRMGYLMFFERDLMSYAAESKAISGVRLILLPQRDCRLLADSRPGNPRIMQHAMQRFEKGDQCFAALGSSDEVVHSRWISTNDTYIPELELNTRPRARQAYMYDGYSKPEWRGRGVDGAIRNFIFETLKAQGIENVYSYVRSDNPVGIRAASRWQQPVGKVWYLQVRDQQPFVFGRRAELPMLVSTT